jgi:FkbM family methyltransferase
MSEKYVLLGAGTTGRVVARNLKDAGTPAVCFADNNKLNWGLTMEGLDVTSPLVAKTVYPKAVWIATAIIPKFRAELLAQIEEMGVKSKPMWGFIMANHGLPPQSAIDTITKIVTDDASIDEWWSQYEFRKHKDSSKQLPPSPISEIYFPDWIKRSEDECFIDCGAADGDTVKEFMRRWPKFAQIRAFEPDSQNFNKFHACHFPSNVAVTCAAVSDFTGKMTFTETGDYSSHLGGNGKKVYVVKLDDLDYPMPVPTYMKMDIEGSELEALWGARRILKEHSPVLAICAYHTSDHLWQIPLLIHAIQPDYKLLLRRYAEGAFELVWYAVPPERLK